MMIPPFVFSSAAAGFTMTLSAKGLILKFVAMVFCFLKD
jgi:hypothetical protein